MEKLVKNLENQMEFHCGMSATAFRFFIARLSRETGNFALQAEPSLLKRNLEESISFLSQLSVDVQKIKGGFKIRSKGWKIQGDGVYVPGQTTSQYASALLLNSWNLDKDLYFHFSLSSVSYPYFNMTLQLLKKLGLKVHQNRDEFFVPKNQTLKKKSYRPEQDKSCLFALACFAGLHGSAFFLDWEEQSLQADHIFPEVLKKMGVPVLLNQSPLNLPEPYKIENLEKPYLKISKANRLKPIDINLKGTPDLFPMLAILCAQAEGRSHLRGLSHLAFKESNRIKKIESLLKKCQINCGVNEGDFWIEGRPDKARATSPFTFDPEKDHRIVMAVELLKSLKAPIELTDSSPVNKSFPDFYSCIS